MSNRMVSLRELQREAPFSTDKVSVQNLDLIVNAGHDMWGRQKPQRVLMSVTLSMKETFASAAQTDTVDASTVHYGKLSKSIISRCESLSRWINPHDLLDVIVSAVHDAAASPTALAVIEAEVVFPKASRTGEGIGLRLYHIPELDITTTVLRIHRASLLALIGVNANERLMKQRVIVSVALDRVQAQISETYFALEQIVEKTVEESSYETLESLAEDLAARIIKFFVLSQPPTALPAPAGVRITIEKPNAIPFADAPVIEIYRSAEESDVHVKKMVAELGLKRPQIPFPLQGRLDEFLQSWKQD